MKRNIIIIATATVMTLGTAAVAQAACTAEYKAKRDNPLELFYDVAQISGPCTRENARAQLQKKLARQGLTLLKVLSVKNN